METRWVGLFWKILIPIIFCFSVSGNPVLLEGQLSDLGRFGIPAGSNLAVRESWFLARFFEGTDTDSVNKMVFKLCGTIRSHVSKKLSAFWADAEGDSKSPPHVRAVSNETELVALSNQRLERTIQVYKEGQKAESNAQWLSVLEWSRYFTAKAALLVSGWLDEVKELEEPAAETSGSVSPDQMPQLIALPSEAVAAENPGAYVQMLIDLLVCVGVSHEKGLKALEHIINEIPSNQRAPFLHQLLRLVASRDGGVSELVSLASILRAVPLGEQLESLVAGREGDVFHLMELTNFLGPGPFEERELLVMQLQRLAVGRAGHVSHVTGLANVLVLAIRSPRAVEAIGRLIPEMTVHEVTDALNRDLF